jgi:tetratricopeptide (TPR) repeat protein
MKLTMKLLFLFFGVLTLANAAYAQSPREELQQMVEQLQKTPGDNALREKIIKMAQELKPAPAILEEVERRMVRGAAAFKIATSAAGFQDAAKEFEQATQAAPWYGDAYFNLGVSQDKAGNYEAALRSLTFAQLASPDSKEIKTLMYEVEFRQEKANSPEARAVREAARAQEAEARFLASLGGGKYACIQKWDYYKHYEVIWTVEIEKGKIYGYGDTIRSNTANVPVGFKHAWFTIDLKGRVSQGESYGDPNPNAFKAARVEIFDGHLTVQSAYGPIGDYGKVTCRR